MEDAGRDGRDAAGIGPYARERDELVALSSLGSWTVSEGEPDVRGWEVRTVSGRILGSVADLLVDEKAGEVVMLDVDLPGTDRHTFVAIRVVHIDRAKRVILMDSADLPESGLTRDALTTRSVGSAGSVRYPHSDADMEVARPAVTDDRQAGTATGRGDSEAERAKERRRGDRRRIERVGSDF